MLPEDRHFAVDITDQMNWKFAEGDFEFAMELEPEGCFLLLCDSERVGLVTNVCFGKVGWLGNLIVSESHRGKGAGSLLVKHSLQYFASRNVETVGLYAYADRIPLYERLGFEYESEFVVLKGKGFSSPRKTSIRKTENQDVRKVIDYDQLCFGASRRKLLEPILFDEDNLCYLAIEGGKLAGYAVAKVYKGVAELGPLICSQRRSNLAIGLLKATLNELEALEVSVCVQKKESSIIHMLMGFGFTEGFNVARMFLGPQIDGNCTYIAESLERG